MQESKSPGHLFVFGLGYSASRLARRLIADGWQVSATTRDPRRSDRPHHGAISSYRFDGDRPDAAADRDIVAALAKATHCLISVPPDANGDLVLRHFGERFPLGAVWIGYLSTTGVYGDHDGGWVDETTPPRPITRRGQRRLVAELAWQRWAGTIIGGTITHPLHIFRLPGIYGPGRNALATLAAGRGRRLVKPGHVFSRIHVDDLGTALAASMQRPRPGAIYNICDDEPAASATIINEAARLLGCDPPPEQAYATLSPSSAAYDFYRECKRVRNDLIKTELALTWRYPTYREGLGDLMSDEGGT